MRSLSATNAAAVCLFLQSYAEKQGHQVALPLSAVLLAFAGGRNPMLLRFHLMPLLQGFVAAKLVRCWAAKFCSSLERIFSRNEAAADVAGLK